MDVAQWKQGTSIAVSRSFESPRNNQVELQRCYTRRCGEAQRRLRRGTTCAARERRDSSVRPTSRKMSSGRRHHRPRQRRDNRLVWEAARAQRRRARTRRRRSSRRLLMWSIPPPWLGSRRGRQRHLAMEGGCELRRRPDRSSMMSSTEEGEVGAVGEDR
jgi:hypothetical protein